MEHIFFKLLRILPDKVYLQMLFFKHFHRLINFKKPRTFNEKIQWLKIYNRKPEYTTLVDKHLVKEYVASKIGKEYVIPTLGVWNHASEIDFNELPNQFVLKWNHDSGSVLICKDKSKLNYEDARSKIDGYEDHNAYWYGREWPYKNVKPCIIAEPYLVDSSTNDLPDYKFFCFNGKVKLLFIASNRQKKDEETYFDYFDENFKRLELSNGHPHAPKCPSKPKSFDLMVALAETLSKGIPHVRVDFYEVDCKVYFGEMTFYNRSGLTPFQPRLWDEILGSWLKLNKV
ncbi:glycosyl transferase [Candidatus Saccharibacteria bacterium]|nr:glycosyl transferase [Candidatus Saccharibacteria bacterium]